MTSVSPPSRRHNELDVLLHDLSNARYAGGPRAYDRTESQESSRSYSSSIVQQVNGYHPQSQIVPAGPTPQSKAMVLQTNGTDEVNTVHQKVESLMTEEETIVEERKQYRFTLGRDWDSDGGGREKRKEYVSTTAYATIHPQHPRERHQESIDVLVCTADRVADHHLGRRMPVDMPMNLEVPKLPVDNLHVHFDKPGIRAAQDQPGYGGRQHVDDTIEIEVEEPPPPPRPESPPRRPDPICAACSRSIQGRCITAMMRKFHPEHFVCSYCLKILNKGTFKEREDKPYCQECHYRLFG